MQIRKLISMIPMNNTTKAEKIAPAAPLPQYDITSIVPSDPTVPYDVRDVIKTLVDESEFLEVMELFAANIVVGFGRIAGETVGFIANQPLVMAGVLDCDSSDKAARFIRFCDCFNIPIVTLEDLPGYLPGVDQEHAGVIRHGARCCTLTARRPFRRSPSCCARLTAEDTSPWDRAICVPISCSLGLWPRLP